MHTESEYKAASLHEVRLAILRQHTQLAQLLDELESHANRVIKGEYCTSALHDALVLLHSRFGRHLDYEETRLLPLLGAAPRDAANVLRAALGDHADQRARIDGLLHDRTVFTDARTLAREALAFVHAIRVDMAEEDSGLRALG